MNGTTASVNTALAAITNGTLAGSVPGVGLIAAVVNANTAIDTFAKATAVSSPTLDTVKADLTAGKDGSVTSAEATAALGLATTARTDAIHAADATAVGTESTTLLTALKADATTAASTTKTAALAVTGTSTATNYTGAAAVKAINDFDAAVAAKAALVLTPAQVTANTAAQASAQAGVDTLVKATGTTVTYTTLNATFTPTTDTPAINSAASLYTALKSAELSVTQHAALVAEISKVPTFGAALVASAEKELAVTKANALVVTTTAEVAKIDSDGATTVKHEGKDYTDAATALAAKTAAVKAATDGDTAVATVKAVVDQYTTLNKASTDATAAINAFNTANAGKSVISALTAATDATAAQDVFYFPAKIVATNDFAVGGTATAFGAGDSIVLGSGYTFNSGALSTGNATALEVFFVKGATGTQVVIETNAVGSATTVTDTAGTVTSSNDTAVINLVGVTADHLSFSNGVVSYV